MHPDLRHTSVEDVVRHTWEQSRGSISLTLVVVCTVLFLGTGLVNSCSSVSRADLVGFLGLSYVGVFRNLWVHQFVTAPLMHGGVVHLLFNMLALWTLGPGVEKKLGRGGYIFFSVVCAICSTLGFLLFNWGTGNVVVGYSGVIFGILVAQAVFFPDNVIHLFAFFPLKMKYAVLLLGAVELYLTISPEGGGIAHAAHLLGALSAFAYLKIDSRFRRTGEPGNTAPTKPTRRKAVRPRRGNNIPREL